MSHKILYNLFTPKNKNILYLYKVNLTFLKLMETHDSTAPYYLESKTKNVMSNFRDVDDVFSDFIIDFDIFSDDETETENWSQFYIERDKNYYENEYKLFKNDMNTYINIFLCELKQIKAKEENIYSNEQKWIDVKLYKICIDINITYDMLYKPNIIFYHSNVKYKIDKICLRV